MFATASLRLSELTRQIDYKILYTEESSLDLTLNCSGWTMVTFAMKRKMVCSGEIHINELGMVLPLPSLYLGSLTPITLMS